MKVAVLSDIHSNLEALEAVQEDLDLFLPDRVVCLGDIVGYGPDPEAVVSLVRRLGYSSIIGNHEAALAGNRARDWMNFQARENSISTKALLSPDNLKYCCELPVTMSIGEAHFVHGCPPDSVNTYLYLMSDEQVLETLENASCKLFFVGHTHELMLVFGERGRVVREFLPPGRKALSKSLSYVVNCGSVGQPRDGDCRAKYVIWDSVEWSLEVRAVNYDYEITAEKILARGFPRGYADRLR